MDRMKVTALRMERQFLSRKIGEQEYIGLYRDLQPGQNVYWNGFGDPPSLTFRADFDDIEFNRRRQLQRELVKGRFSGGNLGWIMREEMELFACLFQKPITKPVEMQMRMLELIERQGPLNIQQIKEETGLLVKEITPILHRLQEAFLIYEDQYDGEWDRGWYPFGEMFPNVSLERYSRREALKIILPRFAYRNVWFCVDMAKSYYRLPAKELTAAAEELADEQVFVRCEGGYLLQEDKAVLEGDLPDVPKSVYAMHRNDFLVKSNEYWLKEKFRRPQLDTLQYLLIDGEFRGAVLGHFKNGPYLLEKICADAEFADRKEEILRAVELVNGRQEAVAFEML